MQGRVDAREGRRKGRMQGRVVARERSTQGRRKEDARESSTQGSVDTRESRCKGESTQGKDTRDKGEVDVRDTKDMSRRVEKGDNMGRQENSLYQSPDPCQIWVALVVFLLFLFYSTGQDGRRTEDRQKTDRQRRPPGTSWTRTSWVGGAMDRGRGIDSGIDSGTDRVGGVDKWDSGTRWDSVGLRERLSRK